MVTFWYLLLWSLRQTIAILFTNLGYVQVPNIFYQLTTNNLLSNTSGLTSLLQCQSWCSSTPDCTLCCTNGNYCFLSSALVAPYWVPKAQGGYTLQTYAGYKCYSNWVFENDLTSLVPKMTGSAQYTNKYSPDYTTDGYYADTFVAVYLSGPINYAWIQLDMGEAFSIQKIIIKIYGNAQNFAYFNKVEARVGNTSFSSSGIRITVNSFFANYTGPPNRGDVVTLISSSPIVGRYITLQQLINSFFNIGEIKIIGF